MKQRTKIELQYDLTRALKRIEELERELQHVSHWASDKERLADRLLSIMEWRAKEGSNMH